MPRKRQSKQRTTFRVIASGDLAELTQEVTLAIRDGWQLSGGISASFVPEGSIWKDGMYFLQSLVKKERLK